MRRVRWIAGAGLLAAGACSNPAEPRVELDCGDPRRPCDQLLPEITDRTETPYLADPATVVVGDAIIRRR